MKGKKCMVTGGGLLVLLCFAASVAAQGVFYVRPTGTGNGSSWEQATNSVKGALTGRTAGDSVKVEQGEYLLEEELTIPAGVVLSGGWIEAGARAEVPAKVTVLRANGLQRVATVFGEIEGVTVTGGVVNGEDGGGLYVKSSGKVTHCVVTDNVAKAYDPKIGDLMLTDGTFYAVGNTPIPNDVKDRARGVVFWLNPDQSAPQGPRGWICAMPLTGDGATKYKRMSWATADIPTQVTDQTYASLEEALRDTAGWTHTQEMKKHVQYSSLAAAQECLNYATLPGDADRGAWYLPALGQLKFMYTEMSVLNNTYYMLGGADGYSMLIAEANTYTSTESGIPDKEIWVWFIRYSPGSSFNFGGVNLALNYDIVAAFAAGYVVPVTSF